MTIGKFKIRKNQTLKVLFFEIADLLVVAKKLNRKIDLIKLDIERAELPLLEHARKIIYENRPTIFCEILENEMYSSFQNFFEEMEYEYIQISDSKKQYFFTRQIIDKSILVEIGLFILKSKKEKLLSVFNH